MPELWFRKALPKVYFLNSNVPEDRYRMFCSIEDLGGVPRDSTDIFNVTGLINATFKSGKFAYLDSICSAEFYLTTITLQVKRKG